MLEDDDVVEPHDADVEEGGKRGNQQPERVEAVQRGAHIARMDGAELVPRQDADEADDDDRENLRGMAEQPQQAVPQSDEEDRLTIVLGVHLHGHYYTMSRMKNLIAGLITASMFLSGYFGMVPTAQRAAEAARRPGPIDQATTLLPNGWRIAPAGRHLPVGDLPLAFVASPDGRNLIITNNGYSKPSLTIVDTQAFSVRATVPVEHAWLGLAWHPDGKRLYSTGQDQVQEFAYEAGTLKLARTFALPRSATALGGGLAVSADGRRVLAIRALEQQLLAIDLDTGEIAKTVPLPAEAYTCLLSQDGKRLFVSLWGGARVLAFDADTLEQVGEATVGEHPNAMVQSKKGDRLFVACANTNAVWVIEMESMTAKEQIGVAMSVSYTHLTL